MMNKHNDLPISFIQRMKEKVRRMKQDVLALYYAYREPGTPWTAKVLIGITIGYLLSPIDLIPDLIPVLGLLDDLVIVPMLIVASIRLIPADVWLASKLKAEQFPIILNKKNWLFAVFIVLVWLLIIYFFIQLFLILRFMDKNKQLNLVANFFSFIILVIFLALITLGHFD